MGHEIAVIGWPALTAETGRVHGDVPDDVVAEIPSPAGGAVPPQPAPGSRPHPPPTRTTTGLATPSSGPRVHTPMAPSDADWYRRRPRATGAKNGGQVSVEDPPPEGRISLPSVPSQQ